MQDKKFFGYKAAVGAFLVIFVNLGVCSTLGVFMSSLAEYSGWDLGTVGLIGTVNTIGNIVLSIAAVAFMKKFGTKITMIVSILMCALHVNVYCLVSEGQNVPSLAFMYIAGFLASFSITFGTHAVCGAVIAEWFVEKREQITGIVFSGAGFGAAIWVFIAGQLFQITDFKGSYRVLGIMALAIGLFAVIFLIRSPEKMGQKPLGWDKAEQLASASDDGAVLPGLDKKTAMKTPSFWILALALLCVCAAGSAFMAYAPAAWQAAGWSSTAASNWDAIYLLLAGLVLLGVGKITARVKPGVFVAIVCAAYAVCAVLMAKLGTEPVMGLMIMIVLFGAVSYPLSASIPGLMGQSIFGIKDAAAISATLMTAVYCGQALYAPIMAAFLKKTGFSGGWIFFGAIALVGMVLIILSIAASPYTKSRKA